MVKTKKMCDVDHLRVVILHIIIENKMRFLKDCYSFISRGAAQKPDFSIRSLNLGLPHVIFKFFIYFIVKQGL